MSSTRPSGKVSLGLGLTNDCNLRCAHCYRPSPPIAYLPLEAVRDVCESLDVGGVNLGTGENALHPDFDAIVGYLLDRGLRVSLTSNGLSVAHLPDAVLRRLHDVEVSIDYPDPTRFDAFRGEGAWETAIGALERCRSLSVPATVLAVLMSDNHRDMGALARVAASLGVLLRVNVYQPVMRRDLMPAYAELWWAVRDLLESTTLIACSEPVVNAAAGLRADGLRCGRTSLRITPRAELLPCVYSPAPAGSTDDVRRLGEGVFSLPAFGAIHAVPDECRGCEWETSCAGGCASRRMLTGGLTRRDPYCPKIEGIDLRGRARLASDGERLHTGNVCTWLVRG